MIKWSRYDNCINTASPTPRLSRKKEKSRKRRRYLKRRKKD